MNELLPGWTDSTIYETGSQPTIVDDLPVSQDIVLDQTFIIKNCESRYLTHLFHKYPGKFIPHIPRWSLKRYTQRTDRAIVLDPFVGSGTTLVETCLYGQSGYGVDVDPLARLITKVKTTPIPAKRLRRVLNDVTRATEAIKDGRFRPLLPTLSHWFTDRAIKDLSAIRDVIERYHDDPDIYEFLLVAYSAIIRRSSNADNQTMKTYVSHTNPKSPEAAKPLFIRTVRTYADRLEKFGLLYRAAAVVANIQDARKISPYWQEQNLPSAALVVTSPPYIKSADYIYNQMAELFWIGERWGLETQAKQNSFKRAYIGNDRPVGDIARTLHRTGVATVDELIGQVFARDHKLAHVMWRYFTDMDEHFADIGTVLAPGGHYVLVIGDSTLATVSIPSHLLLADTASRHGFRAVSRFAYEIRNKYMHFPRAGRGGHVVHDWVMDLIYEP